MRKRTLPGPSLSCPGSLEEEDALDDFGDPDVDNEDNSENIHDLEKMGEHGIKLSPILSLCSDVACCKMELVARVVI